MLNKEISRGGGNLKLYSIILFYFQVFILSLSVS